MKSNLAILNNNSGSGNVVRWPAQLAKRSTSNLFACLIDKAQALSWKISQRVKKKLCIELEKTMRAKLSSLGLL